MTRNRPLSFLVYAESMRSLAVEVGVLVIGAGCGRVAFDPHDAQPPPIDFVQAQASRPLTATATLGLPSPVAVHDAIVVCFDVQAASGADLTQVTDTLGNSYAVIVGPVIQLGHVHYIVVALDSPAGADTVTITLAAPPTGSNLLVAEYAGLALVDAFDAGANASGTGAASSPITSGVATTTAPHELVRGYAEAMSSSAGAGFTTRATRAGDLIEDQVVTAVGSYEATAIVTGTWTMMMVTFRGR